MEICYVHAICNHMLCDKIYFNSTCKIILDVIIKNINLMKIPYILLTYVTETFLDRLS